MSDMYFLKCEGTLKGIYSLMINNTNNNVIMPIIQERCLEISGHVSQRHANEGMTWRQVTALYLNLYIYIMY